MKFAGERGSEDATFTKLSRNDRLVLKGLVRDATSLIAPRRDIIREGDDPRLIRLIVDGWACRYKSLPDGRRQTVGFFIPGDLFDLNISLLKEMDHSVGAISEVRVATLTPDEMETLARQHPQVAEALKRMELVNASIQREWLVNLGQRSAYERIGHLLVELYLRLEAVGLACNGACEFPLTQIDIADATGITAVHVNRMLQQLRRDGLVELTHKRLALPDLKRLMQMSMFNPNYLHLNA